MSSYFFFYLNCHVYYSYYCFYLHKIYFLNNSIYISNFNKLWFNKYGVTNVLENDLCALISRIWFVQSREESSMFFWNLSFCFHWQIVHFHNYISVFDDIKIIIIPCNCVSNLVSSPFHSPVPSILGSPLQTPITAPTLRIPSEGSPLRTLKNSPPSTRSAILLWPQETLGDTLPLSSASLQDHSIRLKTPKYKGLKKISTR